MEKISWTDHVRNEDTLHSVKEYPTHNTKEIGYIGTAFQNTLLKKRWRGKTEVTRRWGRSRHLLDYHTEMRGYWKLKVEALDHTLWRTRFGRGCGPATRQTPEWMNFKQPATKDNQMRPEVLMIVMMKNTGFWEVIFLRNTHQYIAKFLPYNIMSHIEKWDSSSAIRHFSAWITLHCYKCLSLRVHHTGCPENLGFHSTVPLNTLTNVKTDRGERCTKSSTQQRWKHISGTSCTGNWCLWAELTIVT